MNCRRTRNNFWKFKKKKKEAQTFKSIVERENSGNFLEGRNKIQRDGIREDLRKIEEQFRSCVYNYQKLQRDET